MSGPDVVWILKNRLAKLWEDVDGATNEPKLLRALEELRYRVTCDIDFLRGRHEGGFDE